MLVAVLNKINFTAFFARKYGMGKLIKTTSVKLFEYKKIGLKILQSCEIERKMALLFMQKFQK